MRINSSGLLTNQIGAVFNESSADSDFRVESDNNANMLFVDAGNNRVGIGTSSPTAPLEVNAQTSGTFAYTALKVKYGTSSVQSLSMGQVTAGNGGWFGTAQYRLAGNWQSEGTAAGVVSFSAAGNISFSVDSGLTANTDYIPTERFSVETGEAVFNDPSNDYDFRVESDTNTHALFVEGSSGNVGISVNDPAGIIDIASGLQRTRSTNGNGNSYNITKYVAGTGAQTALQITIPAEFVFVFIKMTFANSRAPYATGGVGTSYAGERYFAIARNGSGSDVVLDSNVGTKDWTATTTTAGGATSAVSAATTIVRNGAEANTEPQVVNITFNPETTSTSAGAAVLKFEIMDLNLVSIA